MMERKPSVFILVFFLFISHFACAQAQSPVAIDPVADDNASETAEAPFVDPFDDDLEDPFEEDPFEKEQGDEAFRTVADPIAGFNRVMFTFNDKMYFWVLKPAAIGFRTVVPTPVRASVKNFFYNLLMPVRFVNCLLQGKGRAAGGEVGRFAINTTVGMMGFFDPAKQFPELNPPTEDFGQTLGYYSVGNGIYIVWPFLGPSTLRDTVGTIGDWAMNPVSFMQLVNLDAGALTSGTTNVAVYGVRTINDTTFRIGDYETLKNAALDPYEAMRNAYIQNRISKIAE